MNCTCKGSRLHGSYENHPQTIPAPSSMEKLVPSAPNFGDCCSTPLSKFKNVSKESERKVKVTQSCLTLCDPMNLYSPWNSPGQNAGVGSLSLLQGIFPTQGLNTGLPHCRQILYQLSHKGSLVQDIAKCHLLGKLLLVEKHWFKMKTRLPSMMTILNILIYYGYFYERPRRGTSFSSFSLMLRVS